MWRTIPLVKVVLWMTVFGAILGALFGIPTLIAFESVLPAPRSYYIPRIAIGVVTDGILLGALTGIAMALYAAVAHRSIHRPSLFRFAMLIVATTVSIAVVQQPFHIVTLTEFGIPLRDWLHAATTDESLGTLLLGTIAKHTAIGLMSLYLARKYMRENAERFLKATGQQAE